jgi:hypothetical protein
MSLDPLHNFDDNNQTVKVIEEECQLQPYFARIIASKTPLAYNRITDQFPFFRNGNNNKNSHIRNLEAAFS